MEPHIGPDHEQQSEAIGAYVLGALPPDEHAAMERHLAQCDACADEADRLQLAVDVLPSAAPTVEAPPELKTRIMAIVEREAELLAAAGPDADRVPEPRRERRGRWSWSPFARPLATGFAALALVGVGVGGASLLRDDGPASSARTVAATVLDPTQPAAAGASLRTRDGHATLVVHGLADPPRGHVWQLWLEEPGGRPVPAGATFVVRDGEVAIPHALHPSQRVMVTLEPEGGSATPSSSPVIVTNRV